MMLEGKWEHVLPVQQEGSTAKVVTFQCTKKVHIVLIIAYLYFLSLGDLVANEWNFVAITVDSVKKQTTFFVNEAIVGFHSSANASVDGKVCYYA